MHAMPQLQYTILPSNHAFLVLETQPLILLVTYAHVIANVTLTSKETALVKYLYTPMVIIKTLLDKLPLVLLVMRIESKQHNLPLKQLLDTAPLARIQ